MASGIFYPAASGDDGTWRTDNWSSSGNELWFGNFSTDYSSFIRFVNVTIPQGSTITEAFIRFTSYANAGGPTVKVRLYFNDVDNAVAPINESESNALVLTTAFADWDIATAWSDGTTYDSVSLVGVLQEIVDRGGWSSNNAAMFVGKENNGTDTTYVQASAINYSSGAEKSELHVTWTPPVTGEISEGVNVTSEIDDNFGELGENVNVTSAFVCLVADALTSEGVNVSSEITYFESDSPISEDASVSSNLIAEHTGEFSEDASVNSGIDVTQLGEISEDASVSSNFGAARHLIITDTLSSWDALKWSWHKSVADSLDIAETIETIVGITVKEWLALTDIETNNWTGTEVVTDSVYAVDFSKVIQVYVDLIADGMAATDAVGLALELIATDIITCTDTVLDAGTFQHLIEDGVALEDIARRCFPKSISDSFAATDTSLLGLLVLLQIADSFDAADTATRLVTINQSIADSLDALDTVAIQQLIYELIQDGLSIEVVVELDGEVWECWVVNTSDFHISVYSGYDFNSFAILNDTVYGCKSDGIYELSGADDDGTAFKAGIILPATQFNSPKNKRFRKAYFGVSGDNLLMKLDTDNGCRTFRMIDTEMSLTRDLKGRKWKISLESFDSLDFVELTPVILSKK